LHVATCADGIDQWGVITKNDTTARTEMLLNLIPTGCKTSTAPCLVCGLLV